MEPETICFLSTECFRPVMMTHPNFFTFWPSLAAIIWNKRTLFHSCRYRVLDLPLRTQVKTEHRYLLSFLVFMYLKNSKCGAKCSKIIVRRSAFFEFSDGRIIYIHWRDWPCTVEEIYSGVSTLICIV